MGVLAQRETDRHTERVPETEDTTEIAVKIDPPVTTRIMGRARNILMKDEIHISRITREMIADDRHSQEKLANTVNLHENT